MHEYCTSFGLSCFTVRSAPSSFCANFAMRQPATAQGPASPCTAAAASSSSSGDAASASSKMTCMAREVDTRAPAREATRVTFQARVLKATAVGALFGLALFALEGAAVRSGSAGLTVDIEGPFAALMK